MWELSKAQQVKYLVLSLQWLWLLLWRGCDPWPRNFHMPWTRKKKKRCKLYEASFIFSFSLLPFILFPVGQGGGGMCVLADIPLSKRGEESKTWIILITKTYTVSN